MALSCFVYTPHHSVLVALGYTIYLKLFNSNLYLRVNPGWRINMLQFEQLLVIAWEKSATIKNAVF